MSDELDRLLTHIQQPLRWLVMTGAGISAESGIPTFRGPEGYWTVGSREYRPQQLATRSMFASQPELVWAFYLYRIDVNRQAVPNTGHLALAQMSHTLGDRMALITQNVDGLHHAANHEPTRLWEIHGNIRYLRCFNGCRRDRWPLPFDQVECNRVRDQALSERELALLRCPDCGGWARPHVLWFDEYYDEPNYHCETALAEASRADILLVVGTSGATNLPNIVAREMLRQGSTVWEINPESTVFTTLARKSGGGLIDATASEALARIATAVRG